MNRIDDFVAVDVSRLPAIGRSTTVASTIEAVRGGFHHAGYDVAADGRLLIVPWSAAFVAWLRRHDRTYRWFLFRPKKRTDLCPSSPGRHGGRT